MLSKVQKYIDSISSTPHLEALQVQEACLLFEKEREQWKQERLELLTRSLPATLPRHQSRSTQALSSNTSKKETRPPQTDESKKFARSHAPPHLQSLNSSSDLRETIRKWLARALHKGMFWIFSFILVLLAFGSLAEAFTQDDIHCPITNEWKQGKTTCPCRPGWSPKRELLDKIIADHAQWSQQSSTNRADLPGRAVLCNVAIFNADFRSAKLEESVFSGARLMNARFNDAELDFADFAGAHLMNASFDNSRMQTSNFQDSDLFNATFNGTYMPYTNFRNASLINATFNAVESESGDDATTLWNADYTNADLRNAQFVKAELRGAKLSGADLDGATLTNANLHQTVVTGARFSSVDLTGAVYAPVSPPPQNNYAGLIGLHTVTFPDGEQTGLVQLRDQLKRSGLRTLEREATFAIESNKVSHKLQSGAIYEKIVALLKIVFFEWTVEWGL